MTLHVGTSRVAEAGVDRNHYRSFLVHNEYAPEGIDGFDILEKINKPLEPLGNSSLHRRAPFSNALCKVHASHGS